MEQIAILVEVGENYGIFDFTDPRENFPVSIGHKVAGIFERSDIGKKYKIVLEEVKC